MNTTKRQWEHSILLFKIARAYALAIFLGGKRALISVIIPAFNVQKYIRECVESVRKQSMDIEMLIIDDCSTDNTKAIVEGMASEYDNISVLQTERQIGPGGARNLGLKHATGEFVFFLDGDDKVPEEAFSILSKKQAVTKADIVIGNVKKYNEHSVYNSNLHKKIDWENSNLTTHIVRQHDLLFDSTVWNKLYKRSFILEKQIYFPESVSYEDILFSLKAHILADKVSLVNSIVYMWRVRDAANNPSITQSRRNIDNFSDRSYILDKCKEFLVRQSTLKDLFHFWYYKVLTVDFFLYLKEYSHLEKEYQEVLYKHIQTYLKEVPSEVLLRIPLKTRVVYFAIQSDNRIELNFLLQQLWGDYFHVSSQPNSIQLYDFIFNEVADWNTKITLPENHILWTKPYNSYGCEKLDEAINHMNNLVKVKEEAATKHGSYCRIYKDDTELGWIDVRALEINFK
jgi:glycosyltransferase involved in cell wall biosynthesis